MSDILIVGSAGFVGSNLCNYFVQHTKYNISSLDDLSMMPTLQNLQPSINSKYRHSFYLTEAENAKIVGKIFELEKPKTIVYNLASVHLEQIGRWQKQYEEAIKTLRLWLDLSFMNGIEKFIIVSSPKCLYQKLTFQEQEYMSACETSIIEYANKFKVALLKPCNIFGPRQRTGAIVPKIFVSVLQNNILTNVTSEVQDYIYIKDFYCTVLKFINDDFKSGAFYIRNTEWISTKTIKLLAQNIVKGIGCPGAIEGSEFLLMNDEIVEHTMFPLVAEYGLTNALEHTFCWLDANRWSWR